MRSTQSSALKMVLIFTPLIAIPLLAIFGIPEFPSVSASPSQDSLELKNGNRKDPGIGQSQKYVPHDLFEPLGDEIEIAQPNRETGSQHENAWNDPFRTPTSMTEQNPRRGAIQNPQNWNPPQAGLKGWEVDRPGLVETNAPVPADPVQEQQRPLNQYAQNHSEQFLPNQPVPQTGAPNVQTPHPGFRQPDPNPLPEQWPQPTAPPQRSKQAQPFAQHQPVVPSPQHLKSSPAPFPDETLPPQQTSAIGAEPPVHASQAGQPLTWREATERLNELGIKNYHLASPNRQGEGYYFSCFVTPPNNPRITRRFEAEAGDPLQAVHRVLTQVEEWHQRQ